MSARLRTPSHRAPTPVSIPFLVMEYITTNTGFGISLQTGSSAVLSGVTTDHNGLNGLDLQTGSAATVTGTLTATGNRVFGIDVNGSSFTLAEATVTATGNALGIQIATAPTHSSTIARA
jgi:hypothetical protein